MKNVTLTLFSLAFIVFGSGCNSIFQKTDEASTVKNKAGNIRTISTKADRRLSFVNTEWVLRAYSDCKPPNKKEKKNNSSSSAVSKDRSTQNNDPDINWTNEEVETFFECVSKYQQHHYCAEPSPDVAQDLLSNLVTKFGASAEKETGVGAVVSPSANNTDQSDIDENTNTPDTPTSENTSGGASANAQAQAQLNFENNKLLVTVAKQVFTRTQGVQMFRDGLYALCQSHHNGALFDGDYQKNFQSLLNKAYQLSLAELALKSMSDGQKQTTSTDSDGTTVTTSSPPPNNLYTIFNSILTQSTRDLIILDADQETQKKQLEEPVEIIE